MHPDMPGSKSPIFHTPNIEKLASQGMAGVEAGDFAVLQDHWKLLQTKEAGLRLFDVFADPSESKDVAGDNPKIVARLKAFLEPIASLNVQLPKKGGEKGGKKGNKKEPEKEGRRTCGHEGLYCQGKGRWQR